MDWVYKKLEVKCFSTKSPSSFGPKEKWDYIYFLDALDFKNKNFKLYEIRLSNTNKTWNDLKINRNETYKMFCDSGKRPRIHFEEVKKQLSDNCKLIWSGNINDLKILI